LPSPRSRAPMDESSRKLLDQELKTLECRRKRHNLELPCAERDLNEQVLRTDLTGIALSGGGIRSATFCLGVLQALAKADLLKRFDYLSTVSGGGYIGASLTWWLSDRWRPTDNAQQDRPWQQSTQVHGPGLKEAPAANSLVEQPWSFGLDANSFPYGVGGAPNTPPVGNIKEVKRPKDAGPHLLNYLRKHGNYLTPAARHPPRRGRPKASAGLSRRVRLPLQPPHRQEHRPPLRPRHPASRPHPTHDPPRHRRRTGYLRVVESQLWTISGYFVRAIQRHEKLCCS
jgi:Patatin-like phospholipase